MQRNRRDEEAYKMNYPQPGDRRAELYHSADQALREKLDGIQAWLEREYRHHALALYELGRQCQEVYDDVSERQGRRYGAGAVDVIEAYFNLQAGLIYRALRLANAYSEQEIREATAHPKQNGEPVSVQDLLVLARVEDPALRQGLLAQALAQGWRSDELADAVVRAIGKERALAVDGRGRPLAVPRTFDGVLRQQERAAKDFVNRAVNVWEKPDHSLLTKAAVMAIDDYTEERAARLRAHAELMDQLAQEARERAEEARQVYEQFVTILAGRRQRGSQDDVREEQPLPRRAGLSAREAEYRVLLDSRAASEVGEAADAWPSTDTPAKREARDSALARVLPGSCASGTCTGRSAERLAGPRPLRGGPRNMEAAPVSDWCQGNHSASVADVKPLSCSGITFGGRSCTTGASQSTPYTEP